MLIYDVRSSFLWSLAHFTVRPLSETGRRRLLSSVHSPERFPMWLMSVARICMRGTSLRTAFLKSERMIIVVVAAFAGSSFTC